MVTRTAYIECTLLLTSILQLSVPRTIDDAPMVCAALLGNSQPFDRRQLAHSLWKIPEVVVGHPPATRHQSSMIEIERQQCGSVIRK
jgi:hypothetical protein